MPTRLRLHASFARVCFCARLPVCLCLCAQLCVTCVPRARARVYVLFLWRLVTSVVTRFATNSDYLYFCLWIAWLLFIERLAVLRRLCMRVYLLFLAFVVVLLLLDVRITSSQCSHPSIRYFVNECASQWFQFLCFSFVYMCLSGAALQTPGVLRAHLALTLNELYLVAGQGAITPTKFCIILTCWSFDVGKSFNFCIPRVSSCWVCVSYFFEFAAMQPMLYFGIVNLQKCFCTSFGRSFYMWWLRQSCLVIFLVF